MGEIHIQVPGSGNCWWSDSMGRKLEDILKDWLKVANYRYELLFVDDYGNETMLLDGISSFDEEHARVAKAFLQYIELAK